MMDTSPLSQCLDITRQLISSRAPFKFNLQLPCGFKFNITTTDKEPRSRKSEKVKKSPSTHRRNAARKQKFLDSKQKSTEEVEKDKTIMKDKEESLETQSTGSTSAKRLQEEAGTGTPGAATSQANQRKESKVGGDPKERPWVRGRRRHRTESRAENVTNFIHRLGVEEYSKEYEAYFEKNGFIEEKQFIEKVVALFGCDWITDT